MGELEQKVLTQVMDMWVQPEIAKRKSAGRLAESFSLYAAQVIFSQDRKFNKVRLNGEIKAIANAKAARNISKGEFLTESDIDDLGNLVLTSDDPNCAHISLMLFKGMWHISIDMRYNKGRAKEHLDAAQEFLASASSNLSQGLVRPFFDNAFSCAELLTHALLIQIIAREKLKDHRLRLETINRWAELGNVNKEFAHTLEKLSALRSSARYLSSTEFKSENPQEYLKELEKMLAYVAHNLLSTDDRKGINRE